MTVTAGADDNRATPFSFSCRDGRRQTFVGRGIGHLAFPMRFNCPPEAALITLRGALGREQRQHQEQAAAVPGN